jgi:pimeloyl-ACP methyl ester carboxylesterase
MFDRIFAGESLIMDDSVRATQPGQSARLSDGVTYYELGGPKSGKPVVLIHGFSMPNFIWDPTFSALTAAGFRTLRYDLFGRGFSDRPQVRYDKGIFIRQLADLLDAMKFQEVDIVSLSMGGVIAAEFAFRFPKRVGRLAFIDPAGFDLGLPFAIKLLNVPLIGEFLLGGLNLFGRGTLLESMQADFYKPTEEMKRDFIGRYSVQMQYRGFKRSLLSSLRAGMLDEDLQLFKRLGELNKPNLLIWGKEDPTVPVRYNETFRALVPNTEFHLIERTGHIPHYEKPETINPILIEFLNR